MKILTLLLLSLAPITYVSAMEQRFDPELEKKCFKQVAALKCGSPEGKNNPAFMKCVDKKISKLSKECQEMHKALSSESHSGHDH